MIRGQMALWILTGLSITGTVLNIYKRRACFVFWLLTNISWAVHNWRIHERPQAVLFMVYAALALWGLTSWRKSH